jgi:glycosyltransferase involved in cell wall biosynthesis
MVERMKIAQISPLAESVPPRLYGGTERIVSYLTEELMRQGHKVTLFASGDSRTAAELYPVVNTALRFAPQVRDAHIFTLLQFEAVRARAAEFDVIHFHTDYLHFPLRELQLRNAVTTLHGRLIPGYPEMFAAAPRHRRWCRSRTISDARCRTQTGLAPYTTDCPGRCAPISRNGGMATCISRAHFA